MKRNAIAGKTQIDATSDESLPGRPEVAMEEACEQPPVASLRERIRQKKIEVERCVLIQALRKTRGNKAEAARLLRINYSTLHLKIKRYGLREIL
jgi:DNA-binding NtrC family response regulator